LQQLGKEMNALPGGCRSITANSVSPQIQDWQLAVIGHAGRGRNESVNGLLTKTTLDPALRSDLTNLQFSAGGGFVLAQDESSIY
jgi:hypothetical protein